MVPFDSERSGLASSGAHAQHQAMSVRHASRRRDYLDWLSTRHTGTAAAAASGRYSASKLARCGAGLRSHAIGGPEGWNVAIEYRWAEGTTIVFPRWRPIGFSVGCDDSGGRRSRPSYCLRCQARSGLCPRKLSVLSGLLFWRATPAASKMIRGTDNVDQILVTSLRCKMGPPKTCFGAGKIAISLVTAASVRAD